MVKKPKLRKEVHAMFEEFIQSYQSSYPHMRIILATVHMDEPKGTPHMHILVPVSYTHLVIRCKQKK